MKHPAKLLEEAQLSAKKSLGQNFLINTHSLNGIENHLNKAGKVIEVGPGLGAVTGLLLHHGYHVTAVEKDGKLAERLTHQLNGFEGFQVLHDDFLKVNTGNMTDHQSLVGNLPFYITSPIIIRVIKEMPFIQKALFGIQKEVASRILQRQGNSLAVFIASQGDVFRFSSISRNSFYPVPQVDAEWILFERKPLIDPQSLPDFELLLRAAFWGKRKSLANTLKKNPFWQQNETTGNIFARRFKVLEARAPTLAFLLKLRSDALSLENFIDLFNYLKQE